MGGAEFAGMIEARRRGELGQRVQGRAVEIVDPLGLVGHDEGARARGVLGGDAGRAAVGVAGCDWMQPSENMKPRAELHQSAPSAMARAMSKAVMILPAAPILMRWRAPMPTARCGRS